MVKIIGIFAIVFVYYCEINAELDNLQYMKTPTADVRRILSSQKKLVGNRSGEAQLHNNSKMVQRKSEKLSGDDIRFTTGFREDIKDQHKQYILRNGEAHYNDEVKKRRFKRSYRDDEYNQIDEHDNERKKPKKKKRHHHHSRSKMNKNHNSTRNKKTKSNKNEERNRQEDKKLNKEKNHSGKRNRDKNHSKYSELLKDKDKSKDRNKHATTERSMKISKMGLRSPANKKSDKRSKKQKLNKSKDEQREKSKDRNKHATTEGPMGISKMGMMSPANKNHKHNKKQELNKSKEKQREKSKHTIDTKKTALGIAGLGAAGVAALVGKSLAWESIKEPKLQSEEPLISKTTPHKTKPPPDQKQEVVKLIKRERSNLKAKQKIRVTKMIPFSLNKQEDKGKQNLRQESEGSGSSSAGSPPSTLSPYAITTQMELLMKEFPNVNATIRKVGRTVEYNDIILVSITAKKLDDANFRAKQSKYVDDVPEKKIIFIVHGLSVMGLKDMTSLVKTSELKLLLSYYFKHLDKFDFFLMPLANPDGYAASFSPENTIWNKNVSPQSVCPGVFVDRNFDVAWNHTKELSSCSHLYPGATPFSEEESKVIRDIFHHFNHKILAYIHVHAGTFDYKVFKGDAILYPRGYTETQSDDDKYFDIKGEVDEAMKNASFRVMSATVDTLSNWYGVVSGTSVDYAATVFGITYAMEFVMQLYDGESLVNDALTEIWSRLIDATFNVMWKSQQGASDNTR